MGEPGDPIAAGEFMGKPTNSSSEELKVMPDSLRNAAANLDDVEKGLKKELCEGSSSVSGVLKAMRDTGFDSADSLEVVLDEWDEKVKRLGSRIEYLATGVRNCAENYEYLDESNAYGINTHGTIVYR